MSKPNRVIEKCYAGDFIYAYKLNTGLTVFNIGKELFENDLATVKNPIDVLDPSIGSTNFLKIANSADLWTKNHIKNFVKICEKYVEFNHNKNLNSTYFSRQKEPNKNIFILDMIMIKKNQQRIENIDYILNNNYLTDVSKFYALISYLKYFDDTIPFKEIERIITHKNNIEELFNEKIIDDYHITSYLLPVFPLDFKNNDKYSYVKHKRFSYVEYLLLEAEVELLNNEVNNLEEYFEKDLTKPENRPYCIKNFTQLSKTEKNNYQYLTTALLSYESKKIFNFSLENEKLQGKTINNIEFFNENNIIEFKKDFKDLDHKLFKLNKDDLSLYFHKVFELLKTNTNLSLDLKQYVFNNIFKYEYGFYNLNNIDFLERVEKNNKFGIGNDLIAISMLIPENNVNEFLESVKKLSQKNLVNFRLQTINSVLFMLEDIERLIEFFDDYNVLNNLYQKYLSEFNSFNNHRFNSFNNYRTLFEGILDNKNNLKDVYSYYMKNEDIPFVFAFNILGGD